MNDANEDNPQLQVRSLLMGFVVSRALQVAAELGLADALKDPGALARDVGANIETMNRLIRALAAYGIFKQLPDGRVANTAQSECLRSDSPVSLRELARMYGGSPMWQAWTGLEHSVRCGEPA